MQDIKGQREFCADLKRAAPENSAEWQAFNHAETAYELAECLSNKGPKAHAARMRGVRAYKNGWTLRNKRMTEEGLALDNAYHCTSHTS